MHLQRWHCLELSAHAFRHKIMATLPTITQPRYEIAYSRLLRQIYHRIPRNTQHSIQKYAPPPPRIWDRQALSYLPSPTPTHTMGSGYCCMHRAVPEMPYPAELNLLPFWS